MSRISASRPVVRVLVVGAGRMAQHHIQAIHNCETPAQVVAIADPSRPALDRVAELCPDAVRFTNFGDALRDAAPDVTHICTPLQTHESIALRALEAGSHVYIEKPVALTAASAQTLIAAAVRHQRLVCPGHQLLFEAPARMAARLLPALGSVVHVESYFAFRPTRGQTGRPLPLDAQLVDILPHPVYVLLQFLDHLAPGAPAEIVSTACGPGGTLHATLRRGSVAGNLVVTLDGRPVDSYLRLVGTNGSVYADFVRGTVQRHIGPGASAIDKLLQPFSEARQLVGGTMTSLARRVLGRRRSYPGLAEIFHAFYQAILNHASPPLSHAHILETVRVCEALAAAIHATGDADGPPAARAEKRGPLVVVTGGTGFLGEHVVAGLQRRNLGVRVLARRVPPTWLRREGVEYVECDIAAPIEPRHLAGASVLIHAAAATAGGWDEHQRYSIDGTRHVLRAAVAAGVRRVIHVSSLAVVGTPANGAVDETTPLPPDGRKLGPYTWGKLESERAATAVARELGLELRIVRPGALVDLERLDPPGRLGRRLGGWFIAVGRPGERLGTADVAFSGELLAALAERFEAAPPVLHLLSPTLPVKRSLVDRLKQQNPGLSVVWLPGLVLVPLSWLAVLAQLVLRPRQRPINPAAVFRERRYDTTLVRILAAKLGVQPPGIPGTA